MNLDRAAREYISWPISGIDEPLAFEAKFTHGATATAWLAVETISATEVRALVAGVDADAGTAVYVAPVGRTTVQLRAVDNPEIVVRGGGTIDVR